MTSVKEFDHLKKKLENRRLDYDAKQNKLSKSKKEKPGLEEEARAAKYKYEETYSDMQSLMLRFGDKEVKLYVYLEFLFNSLYILRRLFLNLWSSMRKFRRNILKNAWKYHKN